MNRKRVVRFFYASVHLLAVSVLVSTIFFATSAQAACCKCVNASDSGKNLCLTGEVSTCGDLVSQSTNTALAGVTCEPVTLTDAQCQTIVSGGSGVCSSPPVAANFYGQTGTSSGTASGVAQPSDDDIFPPTLNVPIPGLKFASRVVVDGGEAVIPFLAQYISAVYRYLLGIVLLAASIAVVYGGFHYMLGTTISSIERGKEIIRDALIGLVMVFSAHIILVTLNPALVDFKGLKVTVIAQKSYTDLEEERKRVMAAATVPGQARGPGVEVPVYVVGSGGTVAPEVPPDPAASPEPGKLSPGTVVKDANGVFVAQGSCPSAMVPIRQSDDYQKVTKKIVPSFCMDVYEAPNQQGVKPFNGVAEWEADWYCSAQGKRLCADSEWTRACLGPKGENTYGYGSKYVEGLIVSAKIPNDYKISKASNTPAPCNYDSASPQGSIPPNSYHTYGVLGLSYLFKDRANSLLNPNAPKTDVKDYEKVKELADKVRAASAKVSASEPSGKRPGCVTPEGVFDLTANVQEIILSDSGAQKTMEARTSNSSATIGQDYRWAGFFWSPIAHLGNTSAEPTCQVRWGGGHVVNWRGFENGFRCCMPLNENP